MSNGPGNKSRSKCITRAWCEKCKTEFEATTPSDKEVKYCPVCKAEVLRESIQYV